MLLNASRLNRAILLALLISPTLAAAQTGHSRHHGMHADTDAKRAATEAYSQNRLFYVRLLEAPKPIPMSRHFQLRIGVYDGRNRDQMLPDASVEFFAGMRHGMKDRFAHGMSSTPRIDFEKGILTVDGMYFSMKGDWSVRLTIRDKGAQDAATLDLPCCED